MKAINQNGLPLSMLSISLGQVYVVIAIVVGSEIWTKLVNQN